MESLFADVRQTFRMMRKNPSFSIIAVAALALGIGANTGIFSVVNKVLLEPLPYPQPDRLVKLGRKYPNGEGYSNSIPKYMAWRHNDVFSAMAAYDQAGPGLNLSGGDRPEQVKGIHTSREYFQVFGISPMIGRGFTESEDLPGGPRVAVIGEKLWRSHFGGDASLIGRTISLNSEPYTVVGIMPASFVSDPESESEIWIPLQADPESKNQGHYLSAAARLKPGVTIESARSQMKVIGEQFRRENPKFMDKTESVAVIPMRDAVVGNVRLALMVLLGAVGFVLLIACSNVANLLLARAAGRQKELAIRAAVGASRWRVVRQLLTESVILAGTGGVAGFFLGAWGVRALLLLVPGNLPRLTSVDQQQGLLALLDWRVAAFTLGVSMLTGILFGLFPALQISNPDVASTLREASGRSNTGRRQNRTRKILVAGEMALALVLLVGAALLIRTFAGLRSVNPGIDTHNILTLQTSVAGARYATTQQVSNFTVQVLRRLETLPGVESAASAVVLPTDSELDLPFNIAGKPPKNGEAANGDEQWRSVSPHYFSAFRIPVQRGRVFSERDVNNSASVAIINQAFAKKYFAGEDPVGKILIIGKVLGPEFEDPPRQIVGVVGTVRETGLSDADVAVMYIPQTQVPQGITRLANGALPLCWAIRTSAAPLSLKRAVEAEFQAVDNQMPVSRVRTMDQVISEDTARQNFNMMLLTIFAGIALVLAAIGIYGLMSYSVQQQTQELGIRMALGASRGDLLQLIVRQGMMPAGLGVAIGLVIAFGVTRMLSSLLYGVKPYDPPTFAAVAVLLTAVALFSTYIPARRAMKVDPLTALRNE